MTLRILAIITFFSLVCSVTHAQNKRDIAVRNDKKQIDETSWHYDDLETAIEVATESKRPLMIVFR